MRSTSPVLTELMDPSKLPRRAFYVAIDVVTEAIQIRSNLPELLAARRCVHASNKLYIDSASAFSSQQMAVRCEQANSRSSQLNTPSMAGALCFDLAMTLPARATSSARSHSPLLPWLINDSAAMSACLGWAPPAPSVLAVMQLAEWSAVLPESGSSEMRGTTQLATLRQTGHRNSLSCGPMMPAPV